MKKFILTLVAFGALSISSFGSVKIHYFNKDSKSQTFKVKIDGSYTEVTFAPNKTSNITVPGSATECIIYTSCGEVTINGGDKIEIRNGCIKKLKE